MTHIPIILLFLHHLYLHLIMIKNLSLKYQFWQRSLQLMTWICHDYKKTNIVIIQPKGIIGTKKQKMWTQLYNRLLYQKLTNRHFHWYQETQLVLWRRWVSKKFLVDLNNNTTIYDIEYVKIKWCLLCNSLFIQIINYKMNVTLHLGSTVLTVPSSVLSQQ